MRRTGAAGAAAALCWILFAVTLTIRWIAGDGGLLAAEMLRFAPPETTGLPAGEYPGAGEMAAAYLTGKTETFQYAYTDENGSEILCFQAHEAAHMEDCRGLIQLDGAVCLCCGAAAAVLTLWGTRRRAGREAFLRGVLTGLRIFAAAAAGLLVWATADFDGLFVTFHKAAFRNEGWILNPRTDLLIRLMPEKFFIALGIRGLARALAGPAALEAAARIGLHRIKKRDER